MVGWWLSGVGWTEEKVVGKVSVEKGASWKEEEEKEKGGENRGD